MYMVCFKMTCGANFHYNGNFALFGGYIHITWNQEANLVNVRNNILNDINKSMLQSLLKAIPRNVF